MTDELDPVHAGHVEVGDHHVGEIGGRLQQHQGRFAVRRLAAAHDADLGQQAQGHAALEAVVFHHHDAQLGEPHPFPASLEGHDTGCASLPRDTRRGKPQLA
jgi:hypothetical protein